MVLLELPRLWKADENILTCELLIRIAYGHKAKINFDLYDECTAIQVVGVCMCFLLNTKLKSQRVHGKQGKRC